MTDYSLWEVILNGNKVLKRNVGEVEQEYEPTSAEEKCKIAHGSHKEEVWRKQGIQESSENSTQLEIQGEVIAQEDMNLKLLRSLPSEWKTHALIWRNKEEIETISLDDLYNNLNIYGPELTRSSSTSQNPQNVAFVSSNSNSNTNEADNTAYGVSAAHTQSNHVNSTSLDNLSDAVICAFLASQPNSPQLAREDLEQIDPDDLEEIYLQWEMTMLTIRARRVIKRTCKKLDVNGPRVGFDRSKVECYNFHKNGNPSSSDSEVDSCSKSCVKAYATLKEHYDSLSSDYKKSQFNLVSYKAEKFESKHESADVKNNSDAVEPKTIRKNSSRPPVIEDWNSDDDSEVEFIPNVKDKTVRPSTEKIKFVKSARETVEKVIRPVWNNSSRVNHKNFANKMTHPHPNRRFVPQAVLTRSGKINTAGASVNTVVRPVNTAGSKTTVNHPRPISNAYKKGYSQVTRPFNKYSANKNSIFNKKVNTVRVKDTTARDRAVVSENKEKGVNAVKASACWVWKAKNSSASNTFKKYSYIDARGRSKSIMAWIPKRAHDLKQSLILLSMKIMMVDLFPLEMVKGIKREFSVARTPQQNGVAERKNRTLIEAARTMDHLGKFDGKANEGFFVGYSVVSKAMRVFNRRTGIVKETLNIRFLENEPNVIGNETRLNRLFDVDVCEQIYETMCQLLQEIKLMVLKDSEEDVGIKPTEVNESRASDKGEEDEQDTRSEFERLLQQEKQTNSTNSFNTVVTPVSAAGPSFTNDDPSLPVNAAEAFNAFKDHLFERFFSF
ncbi:ribonuclease H-like domain-containing protein [Tanacetum coccineum]